MGGCGRSPGRLPQAWLHRGLVAASGVAGGAFGLPGTLLELPVSTTLLLRQIAAVAAEHTICPYYLSQELVRWADVVVGDYNYWFDTSAFVYAMAVAEGWRAGLLVDEAHNLVERGRGMYSASLNGFALQGLSRIAPRPLKRPLTRLRAQTGT